MNKEQLAKIQIPMSYELRIESERKAKEDGFSSLQELIRVVLKNYSANKFKVNLAPVPEAEYISQEYENRLINLEYKVMDAIATKKVKRVKTGEDIVKGIK